MRRPLVAGNWKMHGNMTTVSTLLQGLTCLSWQETVDIAVFPSALFIPKALEVLAQTPIMIGGQNCAIEPKEGALTGEIAACQLANLGCKYVLVGHSERRLLLGDDDAIVTNKFAAAKQEQLIPILCLGETLEQREKDFTFQVISSQLNSIIDSLGIDALTDSVLAYEPVWAIGTGITASPDQAQAVHQFIRSHIARFNQAIANSIQILYGGSVKADNAPELFAMPDIDGGLIGGASLNAEEFGIIYSTAGNK